MEKTLPPKMGVKSELQEEEQFRTLPGDSLPGDLNTPRPTSKIPLLQRAVRGVLETVLSLRAADIPERDLKQPALVLSPHKDDETLACGALLAGKIRAGARVMAAFYTDGRHSSSGDIPPEELAGLRTRESLDACRILGLMPEDLVFLELEDGHLAEHEEEARREIEKLLEEFRPSEVYIPYRHETTEDHRAAHRISLAAIAETGLPVRVYEYPIWFWFHWPWVRTPWVGLRGQPERIRAGLVSGWRLLKDFNRRFQVGDRRDLKRKALDRYKSQMVKIEGNPRSTTLREIGGGDFLECFFRESEIFHSYELPGRP